MEIILFIIFLVSLLICSAYFSSAETALFSLSTAKIKSYHQDANPRKKLIASLVLHPRDLLVTVFMLNTLVNILMQNVFSHLFGEEGSWLKKVIIPLVIILILGEIIPKYYGLQHNVKLAQLFAPSIHLLQNFLKPVRRIIIAITLPLSRRLFFFLKKEQEISREELQHVLKTSEAQGILQSEEADLVWKYLDLQKASIKELMCPKEDILCFEIHEPLSKLVYLFTEKRKSYIPVYQTNLDNLMGIISAKKFFLYHHQIKTPQDLQKILSKPLFVPENTAALSFLRRMQTHKTTFAVAVDEYGTIAGLITLDDILEAIIGTSLNENEKNPLYVRSGENEIIANGKLELTIINALFNTYLSSENNMVTLGGWLTEKIGDLPKNGQKYTSDGLLFHIVSVDPNRVKRVYIRKVQILDTKGSLK